MKKLKWALSAVFLICCFALLAGCGNALSTPADVAVNGTTLSWSAVDNANRYVIDIQDKDNNYKTQGSVSKTTYSLANLSEGTYTIKVKATNLKGDYKDSSWSKAIKWTKEYESGLTYTLTNGNTEYEVTSVGKARGDVVIEDYYNGKPVTSIAAKAFYNSGSLKSIVIGANVKTIGEYAFNNCSNLGSVVIPESVTSIGEHAFQSCRSLTEVQLPENITEIADFTFCYCKALATVNIPGKVTAIGESAFEDCDALGVIVIPDSVKSIGESAFARCDILESVDLGNGVETLGDYAFYADSALTEVRNGNSVTDIGAYCFQNSTALAAINLADTVATIGESAFAGCTNLQTVTIGNNLSSLGMNAFKDTALYGDEANISNGLVYAGDWVIGSDLSLTAVTFREGTVGIADYAFRKSSIASILSIPDTVKYIGDYAFYGCNSISGLSLGGAVRVGKYAFAHCDLLGRSTINLGSKLEIIDSYAFYYSANVGYSGLKMPESVNYIGTYAFKYTYFWSQTSSGIVYADTWAVGFIDGSASSCIIKEGTVGISNYAFYKCTTLTNITIADTVSTIGKAAFYGCTGLSSVTFTDLSDLTEICDYAFYLCSGLVTVKIPKSVTSIGRSAFYRSGLLYVTIPKWVENIGLYAFYGCSDLFNVTFAEGSVLNRIDDYAFSGCVALIDIALPDSVVSIGYKSFYNCSSLESVTFGSNLYSIGENAFYSCTALKSIELPDSLTYISKKAFYKCTSLESVTFGSNLQSIGDYSFYNCTALTEILLPETVTSIGSYAFKSCTGLTSIILRCGVSDIGAYAFYGNKHMTIYCEGDEAEEGWNARWNAGLRPVIWGCTLSEDGSYVLSFVNTGVDNPTAKNGLSDPVRSGYEFGGWSAEIDGETVIYQVEQYGEIPEGVTLTAIWNEKTEEEQPAEELQE